jgi:hypothetical protein
MLELGAKFVDMVESRWQASHCSGVDKSIGQPVISRMRWASLTIPGPPSFTIGGQLRDRLQRLKAEGLAVQMSFTEK